MKIFTRADGTDGSDIVEEHLNDCGGPCNDCGGPCADFEQHIGAIGCGAIIDGPCGDCRHIDSCHCDCGGSCADFEPAAISEQPKQDWQKLLCQPIPPDWTPPVQADGVRAIYDNGKLYSRQENPPRVVEEDEVIWWPWDSYDAVLTESEPEFIHGHPGQDKPSISKMCSALLANGIALTEVVTKDYSQIAELYWSVFTEEFWRCSCGNIVSKDIIRCSNCLLWEDEGQTPVIIADVVKTLTDQAIDLLIKVRKYKSD